MRKISVIGLGYVGLPLALAFGGIQNTVGFDIDDIRIKDLKDGVDSTGEIPQEEILKSDVTFTSKLEDLVDATFHIVAVPTPIDKDNQPDLYLVEKASETVGKILKVGDMVVFESTVYPGVTEDICIPILERFSGLKAGDEFKVGYSPERVSPGSLHSLKTIHKLVSGQDEVALEIATSVYRKILGDFVVPVKSIKVAEASKVLENIQRDVNIALINQVSILFKDMGIDTQEVIEAAGTKWNFVKYTPGLVGGHCIGVDPYCLIHSGETRGIPLGILKEARKANEFMVSYIIENCKKLLLNKNKKIEESIVTVLGRTFKENCADTRNSKAHEIISKLMEDNIHVQSYDPVLNWGTIPQDIHGNFLRSDIVILAVAHDDFKNGTIVKDVIKEDGILMDIKGIFSEEFFGEGITYWRL